MSRKPLTQWERQQKEEFEKQLKSYSLTALQNIMNIADKARDQRVRLQANQYLLDKCVGKGYVLFDETEQKDKNLLNINLITVIGVMKYIPPLLRIRLQDLYEARKEGNNNGILL